MTISTACWCLVHTNQCRCRWHHPTTSLPPLPSSCRLELVMRSPTAPACSTLSGPLQLCKVRTYVVRITTEGTRKEEEKKGGGGDGNYLHTSALDVGQAHGRESAYDCHSKGCLIPNAQCTRQWKAALLCLLISADTLPESLEVAGVRSTNNWKVQHRTVPGMLSAPYTKAALVLVPCKAATANLGGPSMTQGCPASAVLDSPPAQKKSHQKMTFQVASDCASSGIPGDKLAK